MKFSVGHKQKIVLAVLVAFVFALGAFISWAGSQAASYIKEAVAEQKFVKGELKISDVGASLNGDVWISNIVWHDPSGKIVAKIPRLDISMNLSDVFGGGLSIGSVKEITIKNPELYLTYSAKDGLNISNFVNVVADEEEKETTKKQDSNKLYRGIFSIESGLLQIESGKNKLVYESFNAKLSYNNLPKVTGTVQAKQNKADFAGKIEMDYGEKGKANITLWLDGKNVLLADFFEMMPVESNFKILSGSIPTFKIMAKLNDGLPVQAQASGNFTELAAQADGIKVAALKGGFNATENEIVFTDVTGTLNEQALQLNGKVGIKSEPYKLDLHAQSTSFKLNALSSGMAINDPFAFNADIAGTLKSPHVKGNFSAAAINTDQMQITNANGKFSYVDGIVKLTDTVGGVHGGSVSANGNIRLADQKFAFDLRGNGINSTAMTATKISGPLAFTAHATGAGDPAAAAVDGNFAIGKGDFNGIPFNSLTGNFSKRGELMSFSNVIVNTLAGSATTNATIRSDGKVVFENIDVSKLSKDNVKESAQEKVKKEIEKGGGKISDALKKIF